MTISIALLWRLRCLNGALDLAAAALRQSIGVIKRNTDVAAWKAIEDNERALAALTAEQSRVPPDRDEYDWPKTSGDPTAQAMVKVSVPPDRERLANRLDEIHHEIVDAGGLAYGELHQAAALLRQPVAAEVEALAREIVDRLAPYANGDKTMEFVELITPILFRRLSLPDRGWSATDAEPSRQLPVDPERQEILSEMQSGNEHEHLPGWVTGKTP